MSDHTAQITKMRTSQRTNGKATAMRRLLAILLGVALAGSALGASLMPAGKQAYWDANGNPLAGGLLYTYSAGTSTPLATYSDQAGTVPNANPVVLDARGEAAIFWGAGPYKVALYTAAGALVWTQDYLYPPLTAAEPLKLYSGGNATTPELVWVDDTNTGFYLIGSDNVGLSLGGTKRWDYAASGSTLTGTLTVSGATTLQSTLGVTGAATFSDAATFASSITVTDSARFASSVTVSGVARFTGSTFVPDPATSVQAASKGYVDAQALTTTSGTITWGTGWTDNASPSTVIRVGKVVMLNINGPGAGSSWTALATLPADYRPAVSLEFSGTIRDASSAFANYPARISVLTDGTVNVQSYLSGGVYTTPFAIGSGDLVYLSASFIAP